MSDLDDLPPEERYLLSDAVESVLSGGEPSNMVEAVRVAFLAVHRYGVDLDGDGREYVNLDEAVREAAHDVRDLATVPVLVPFEDLVAGAHEVVETVESEGGFSRDEPGGLVEEVRQ